MMKKFLAVLLCASMILAVTSCGKAKETPENSKEPVSESEPEKEASVPPEESSELEAAPVIQLIPEEEFTVLEPEQIVADLTKGADTTFEEMLDLYQYYSYVEIDNDETFSSTNGHIYSLYNLEDAIELLEEEYNLEVPSGGDIVEAYIGDENPTLRVYSISVMQDMREEERTEEMMNRVADVIRNDEDPLVRSGAVLYSMTLCEYSDEIYKACAAAADDPDPRVRQNVPACLLWNLDNDAADGKSIIVRMTEDEEPGVRVQAVMALANCGDTSVIPLAEEILKDFSLDYLHTKAALALCDLWYNGVYSEEAYRVSLNYLQGDKMDWLTEVTLLNPFSDGVDEEWAANAPWFDKAELVSVLEKISRNEELGSFITDEAAKTLESLG